MQSCLIALANLSYRCSPQESVQKVQKAIAQAGACGATIVCFPECKVQLDPSEDATYQAGKARQIFQIDGLKFGVVICHEGWRYPETVRFAAERGAQLVFHPHLHESETDSYRPDSFAHPANSFHEKAVLCRAAENTCYFATVNYASASVQGTCRLATAQTKPPQRRRGRSQHSSPLPSFTSGGSGTTSAVAGPDGSLLAFQPYGREGLLIVDLDLSLATGLLASRRRGYGADRRYHADVQTGSDCGSSQ